MKKTILRFLPMSLLLITILLIGCLTGCDEESFGNPTPALTDGTDFSALPEDLKAEIKEAYEKRDVNSKFHGWVEEGGSVHYYGTYNGCVVMCQKTVLAWVQKVEVADSVFVLGDTHILVYKDGEFKQILEAYEDGWLTKESVAKLEERHKLGLKK